MNFIAITGSYATGKTHILRLLQHRGFKTLSADEYIKSLYNDLGIQQQILHILPSIKTFDRKLIARLIFENDFSRKAIEKFIHPKVLEALIDFRDTYQHEKMIFAEVPLLFEIGYEKYFSHTIAIFCTENIRYARAKQKNNFDQLNFDKLKEIQLPQKDKINKANFVIDTSLASELELKIELDNIITNIINI